MQLLKQLSQGKLYWVLLLVLGLSMEAVALYYQYVLDEWPCVLCIHVRIWVSGFIVLSVLALILNPTGWLTRVFHLINTVLMIGFVERSWQTLAVERGWIFGDCNMESGLPNWFALDQWFPALFEVKTSCGYTPYVIFEISTAEILMVASVGLLLLSLLLLVVHCLPARQNYPA
jgi:disulfide bond formation protein DsbB